MAIKQPEKSTGGIMNSKMVRVAQGAAMGYATGSIPGAIAGGAMAAAPDSPAKRAYGTYQTGSAISNATKGDAAKEQTTQDSAMSRRLLGGRQNKGDLNVY